MRLRLKALVVVLLVSLFVAVMIPCVYSRYIRGETLYYISKVDNFREENKTLPRGGVVFENRSTLSRHGSWYCSSASTT